MDSLNEHELDFILEPISSESNNSTDSYYPTNTTQNYNPTLFTQFSAIQKLISSLNCPLCFGNNLQLQAESSNGVRHYYKVICARQSRHSAFIPLSSNQPNSNVNLNRGSKSSCSFSVDFSNFSDDDLDMNMIFLQSIQASGVRKVPFERFLLNFGLGGFASDEAKSPSKLLITGGEMSKRTNELCDKVIQISREIEANIQKLHLALDGYLDLAYDATFTTRGNCSTIITLCKRRSLYLDQISS